MFFCGLSGSNNPKAVKGLSKDSGNLPNVFVVDKVPGNDNHTQKKSSPTRSTVRSDKKKGNSGQRSKSVVVSSPLKRGGPVNTSLRRVNNSARRRSSADMLDPIKLAALAAQTDPMITNRPKLDGADLKKLTGRSIDAKAAKELLAMDKKTASPTKAKVNNKAATDGNQSLTMTPLLLHLLQLVREK